MSMHVGITKHPFRLVALKIKNPYKSRAQRQDLQKKLYVINKNPMLKID
jgi:hypothetical protein